MRSSNFAWSFPVNFAKSFLSSSNFTCLISPPAGFKVCSRKVTFVAAMASSLKTVFVPLSRYNSPITKPSRFAIHCGSLTCSRLAWPLTSSADALGATFPPSSSSNAFEISVSVLHTFPICLASMPSFCLPVRNKATLEDRAPNLLKLSNSSRVQSVMSACNLAQASLRICSPAIALSSLSFRVIAAMSDFTRSRAKPSTTLSFGQMRLAAMHAFLMNGNFVA